MEWFTAQHVVLHKDEISESSEPTATKVGKLRVLRPSLALHGGGRELSASHTAA